MLRKVLFGLMAFVLSLSNVSAAVAQTVITTPTFVIQNQLVTSPIEQISDISQPPVFDINGNPCWGGMLMSKLSPRPNVCTGWDGAGDGKWMKLEFWVTKDRIASWGAKQVAWFWDFSMVVVTYQDGHQEFNKQFALNEGVYVVELQGAGHLGVAPASAGTPDKYIDYTPKSQNQPQDFTFLVNGTPQKPVKAELRVEGVLITTTVEITSSVTLTMPVVLRKTFNAVSIVNTLDQGQATGAYPMFLFAQNPKVEYLFLPLITR